MKPIKTAVIGAGHLGSIHARVYSQLPSSQLVAVCDIQPERARQVAGRLGVRAVTDYRQLLGEVEAVSIAVPTQAHFPIARACIEQGVHTLIEKPITRTLPEADRLLRLRARKRTILQVGHIERFNNALRRVADVLQHPRFVEVHRLAAFQPRGTEVGVVLDLMIHDLDILLWLMKSRVRRVEALGVKVLTPFEDIANARITFRNGAVANLTASRISKEPMRKFRIFQRDAYVSIDFRTEEVEIDRLSAGRILPESIPITGGEEPLKAEITAFLESVAHRRPPPVSGREARDALALALQVTRLVHKNHP